MKFSLSRIRTLRVWWDRAWRFRSAGLGFSLAYGLVFALSATLFLSFLWWHTIGALEREVGQAVAADAHGLAERWMQGGLPGLQRAIQDRLNQDIKGQDLYLLITPGGKRLAGNVPIWPEPVKRADRFYTIKINRAGSRTSAAVHAYILTDGLQLLVGRDILGRNILRRVLTETFLWSWLMVTALAIGGAWVVRGIFSRILSSIVRTTTALTNGDMHQRMPLVGNDVDLVAHSINQMLDRIAKLMEGVKQVSNSIAHDLRTPITRARNRLEDAVLYARTNEEMLEAIHRAVADLDHVTAVFDALMRIAQIEAGARRAAFEITDLVGPLQDIAELYEATAEVAGLQIVLDLPPCLRFYGDDRLIQQAVANLIDNAIKFSPAGTTVTLRARLTEAWLCISVTDEGHGMNDDDLERASERFFRADQARHLPGAGLGLSLVQAVALLHRGSLTLTSPPRGLCALLSLPVDQNARV